MQILKKAQAGTMQSSDLMVVVEPAEELAVEIEFDRQRQFGHLIRARIDMVFERCSVSSGRISVTDRGALDYAIEARVETALRRAGGV